MEQAVRKIALLGMGTVGGGVYEIIERQKEEMPFKIGAALEVVKVLVRNKAKYADRIPAEKLNRMSGRMLSAMTALTLWLR